MNILLWGAFYIIATLFLLYFVTVLLNILYQTYIRVKKLLYFLFLNSIFT